MQRFKRLTYDELTPTLQKVIGLDMPPAKRIAMAKGLIPLGTTDLLLALFFLSGDKDSTVAREAQQSLKELPESLMLIGIEAETSPKLLHFVATRKCDNHHIHEKVALHRNVGESTLAYLARRTKFLQLVTIIAGNERAILREPAILHGLERNPLTPRSTIDRLTRFYELEKKQSYTGDLPEGLRAEAAQPPPELVVEPDLPEAAVDQGRELVMPEERLHPCVRLSDLAKVDFDTDLLFADDLVEEEPEPEIGDAEAEEALKKRTRSMMSRITQMSMVDKLLLGMRGNNEARKILIKNSNKIIQEAVLQNPRITIREIVSAVKEKSTPQSVIERVCYNREWTRYYEVAHQLCWHPKTPMRYVFRALAQLQVKDVEKLAHSRAVPGTTRSQAAATLRRRRRG
jgi:hypothetical protein